MAKIAGTESTAKITSAISIITRARNIGVAHHTIRPRLSGWRTKNFWPCSASVTRSRRRIQRTIGLSPMSPWLSPAKNILIPVNTRKAAKMYSTQPYWLTRAAPAPIIRARSKMTPRMPQNSTRCCSARGMAK